MEKKKQITREDALKSISRVKESRIFLPIVSPFGKNMVDETYFFLYDYTPEQKKDLYIIAIAGDMGLITKDDIDIEALNSNATNHNKDFTKAFQSMHHISRKSNRMK